MSNPYLETIFDFINSEGVIGSYPNNIDLAIAVIVLEYRMREYGKKFLTVSEQAIKEANLKDLNGWYNNSERMNNKDIRDKYLDGGFYDKIKEIARIRNDLIHGHLLPLPFDERNEHIKTVINFCKTFPQVRIKTIIEGGTVTASFEATVTEPSIHVEKAE